MRPTIRLNVTLDDEHALKLQRLAERTHTHEETLARSLLSRGIDHAAPDAHHVAGVLDSISGALERARLGRAQANSGETVSLDEL